MKNILLFALAFVCCLGPISGQENAFKSETLTIKNYDGDGKLITKKTYKDQEAVQFDIPKYLEDNTDIARIKIAGNFTNNSELTVIKFDTKAQEEKNEGEGYCESSEMSLKPFLGFSAKCTEERKGVQIETVIKDSPAEKFGVDSGDIVLSFNGKEVNSFCTLRTEVAAREIGEVVPMTIKEGDKTFTKNITIGARVVHNISYTNCPAIESLVVNDAKVGNDTSVDMLVYPNPSPSMTNVKFNSDDKEAVTFYVIDMNGAVIHKKITANFNGSLTTDFSFDDQAPGTYLFVIEQAGQVHRNKVIHFKN